MTRINAKQYKKLVGFCKKVFRTEKYISSKAFNLRIQQELSMMSTRYRRNMLSLNLISEKNGLIFPNQGLYLLSFEEFKTVNQLIKLGNLIIYENKLKFCPKNTEDILPDFPKHWIIESVSRGVLVVCFKREG